MYGLVAEFESPDALLAAAGRAREDGYRQMEAYSPFEIHGLADAVGHPKTRLPLIVLGGGIAGCVGAYLLQYWASVISYPIMVSGRPLNSWPSFVPVMFELTVLCASLAAVFGMLALNGLPQPYHPLFNVERFSQASRDRFFLCIQSDDPRFELAATRKFLESLNASGVYEVAY
jgi:hypothetical protein